MPRFAYVNGLFVPAADAAVHIEDRGFQFADGVYEVCLAVDGVYWDEEGHLARLERSLSELSMRMPMSARSLRCVMSALMRKNRLKNALLYMQVTRGVSPRNHVFPGAQVAPTLVMTAKAFDLAQSHAVAAQGVCVVTAPDIRWGRVDIKSVSLLPNILAKESAKRAGAAEAWLIKDGVVTEGAASNAWIVNGRGELITHPLGHDILGGITRESVLACARDLQIAVVERAFTVQEAAEASEAFLTSATNLVLPIVAIDGARIGAGAPGPIATRLRAAYIERSMKAAAFAA